MTKNKSKKPIDNLIPNSERTPQELKKMTKKGGKKSGEVRRKRKALRDLFKSMLATPLPNTDLKAKIEAMGFSGEEENYNTFLGMTTLNEALKGNMKAVELIRDTIGEKPKDKIELKDNRENSKLDKIIEQLNEE